MKEKSPDLLKVCEEMPSVGLVQDITIKHLQSKMKKMITELTVVKGMAKSIAEKRQASTMSVAKDDKSSGQKEMEQFATSALKQTEVIVEDIQQAEKCFADILLYTVQDSSMSAKDFLNSYISF